LTKKKKKSEKEKKKTAGQTGDYYQLDLERPFASYREIVVERFLPYGRRPDPELD
jgi:hypothetical protein